MRASKHLTSGSAHGEDLPALGVDRPMAAEGGSSRPAKPVSGRLPLLGRPVSSDSWTRPYRRTRLPYLWSPF